MLKIDFVFKILHFVTFRDLICWLRYFWRLCCLPWTRYTYISFACAFATSSICNNKENSRNIGSSNSADFSIVRIYEFLCSSDSAWGPLNSADTKHHIAIYETVM